MRIFHKKEDSVLDVNAKNVSQILSSFQNLKLLLISVVAAAIRLVNWYLPLQKIKTEHMTKVKTNS